MTYPPETPSSTYSGDAPTAYPTSGSTYSDGTSTYASAMPESTQDTDGNGSSGSATETAKQQAAQVGESASQAGAQVAGVAKEQAANVAQQTKVEAKNLLNQTRHELSSQAVTQQQRVAGGLRSLGSELESMASKADTDGPAAQVARQAADRIQSAAGWLENRDPGQVMTEAQRFARQRPGAFLAIAAVAGLAAGRLTRGLAADSSSDSSSDSSTGTASNPGSQYGVTDQPSGGYSGEQGNGWQGGAAAPDPASAYGSEYGSPQSFETTPPATGWTQEPAPPVAGADYYGTGTGTVGDTGTGTVGDTGTGTVNR